MFLMISLHGVDLTHRLRGTIANSFLKKKKKIINASEETHRPAKTLVQMGLSKGFLAVDSRQQEKKNREDMLKGRGKREIVRERRCQ